MDIIAGVVPVSEELIRTAEDFRSLYQVWLEATPEQRAKGAAQAKEERARERERWTHVVPTLYGLAEKLGLSVGLVEHMAQPYCDCSIGSDGLDICQHAYDLGIE